MTMISCRINGAICACQLQRLKPAQYLWEVCGNGLAPLRQPAPSQIPSPYSAPRPIINP